MRNKNNTISFPAVDPIDSGIFGFNVGVLDSNAEISGKKLDEIHEWMSHSACKLVSVSLSSDRLDEILLLQQSGARIVDQALTMILPKISHRAQSPNKVPVRPVKTDDKKRILEIAGSIFQFGRYHRDPLFPRNLANSRFVFFTEKAIANPDVGQVLYVAERDKEVSAFMITQQIGHSNQWQLGGVDLRESSAMLGPLFFAGLADMFEKMGTKSLRAKISAANTSVLNLYSRMGFIATKPEWVFHIYPR
jgi:hypothetical protein